MKRQTVLILILIVVASLGLPTLFADRVMGRLQRESDDLLVQIDPLRPKVAAVRQLEQEIAALRQNQVGLDQRLLTNDAFAMMQRELDAAARGSGVRILSLALTAEGPVKEYPQLQRFAAKVEVEFTARQYLAFVRLLEQHRLLIGLPDLEIQLPRDASSGGRPATAVDSQVFRSSLTLHFFGKAESKS